MFSLGGAILTKGGVITENLSSVPFSPNGKLLAVSSTTGETLLLQPETGTVIYKLAGANEGQTGANGKQRESDQGAPKKTRPL